MLRFVFFLKFFFTKHKNYGNISLNKTLFTLYKIIVNRPFNIDSFIGDFPYAEMPHS